MAENSPLLLIPGPTNVAAEVAAAGARPMIGHRGPEIQELLGTILPAVQQVLGTTSRVFPLPVPATAAMEASIRNAAPGPFLHLVNGAFSDRWSQVREANGFEGDRLEVEWGYPNTPDILREALGRRDYAAVTIVHSETSTGVLNPLEDLAKLIRKQSDALVLVDTVSSMSAVELRLDEWGVDVCFAGSQKAWALPPGLTLCSVSDRALKRSAKAPAKGFALDFVQHAKLLERWMTPTTPTIGLLHQLQRQLERIGAEGIQARYTRHRKLQSMVLDWAANRFGAFAAEGFRSPTVTTLRAEGFEPGALVAAVRSRGIILGGGYGKTKGELFRIGHMGELSSERLTWALGRLDEVIDELIQGKNS